MLYWALRRHPEGF